MAAQNHLSDARILPQAVLAVCLCHHVRRAARAVTQALDHALIAADLTANQFGLLTVIAAHAPVSVGTLARLLVMDRTTLSRTLKPLKAAGYIESGGASGRRPGAIRLTEAGEDQLNAALPLWQSTQRQLTDRVGAGRAGILLESLEAVAAANPPPLAK